MAFHTRQVDVSRAPPPRFLNQSPIVMPRSSTREDDLNWSELQLVIRELEQSVDELYKKVVWRGQYEQRAGALEGSIARLEKKSNYLNACFRTSQNCADKRIRILRRRIAQLEKQLRTSEKYANKRTRIFEQRIFQLEQRAFWQGVFFGNLFECIGATNAKISELERTAFNMAAIYRRQNSQRQFS